MSEIFLRYVVWGNADEAVTVPIQAGADISLLKRKIIDDQHLDIRPQDIRLLAVSLPFDQLQGVTDPTQIPGVRPLSDSQEKISVAFHDPNVNVIAIVPTPAILNLNVYVPGEATEKTVQILPQQAVASLKLEVKHRHSYFESVDAKDIQLFAVSLPLDELQGVTDPTGLTAARELTDPMEDSSVAFKILRNDHIHVVAFSERLRVLTAIPGLTMNARIQVSQANSSLP